MATDPHYRLLTAEEFLRIDFGPDMKAELDNGVIRMMTGGTRDHSRVQMNLAIAVGNALRGSGCRPYGSDMAVRTHDRSVRYPDLTIDCGTPGDQPDDLTLSDPRVVIEVLSPSTRSSDLTVKKDEYRAIASVDTIAFIDVDKQALAIHQRIENGWTETLFSPAIDLVLPSLGITIPHAEIFTDD
ncbi:Uma2 family endonuclease [Sphingomonas ginsenosidivorax]|uniref:Uma2 family endonuclease n=1 Tax=Sphingomonas ginsenosidivorax TaxID=862135 RepID=A0A5C6UIK8_9SPHN|nr:Uma2 family endonuclease [Sphingomonas ginsenosidivorax]TXC71905.1 Uma2 family endonuclease [Sphingomonas ginsenosidivorax]